MAPQLQTFGLTRLAAALLSSELQWWIGWGVGAGAVKSDNDLNNTVGTSESRVQAIASQTTTISDGDTISIEAIITALQPVGITEAAAFDSAGAGSPPSGGEMLAYADFAVKNLSVGDSINLSFNLTFS